MKKRFKKFIKNHWLFVLFLVSYSTALFYKVIAHPTPFYDWDESLYIQTGLEMFKRRFFLFPLWQGKIWFDKPPLVPFLYALVTKVFFFIAPEISTRLFTIVIALIILTFVYAIYNRIIKNSFLTTLITLLTAVVPIFLQRAQVVNLDSFLLLGWLGYLLFMDNFWWGLFFLFVAMFSKSLIGFYPVSIFTGYYFYLYFKKEIGFKKLKSVLVKIFVQSSILLSWFILMYLKFGQIFWKMQIVESHFRRVTASIEFHFGEHLFYINLVRDQLGIFFYLSLLGVLIISVQYLQGKLSAKNIFYGLYLLPWFIFLNATKTKIFWYLFATIPQFAFLTFYPLVFLKNKKVLFTLLTAMLMIIVLYQTILKQKLFTTFYSQYDSYYDLAITTKKNCDSLTLLIDKKTRGDFATLDRMGLLITTTKWWGNHPAIVYYSGKPTDFIFDKQEFINKMPNLTKDSCLAASDEDLNFSRQSLKLLGKFGQIRLLKKI